MTDAATGPAPDLALGIDTATSACAAAVWSVRQGRVLSAIGEPLLRGQAERLVPLVREALDAAGIGFADLSRIGVTVGPGTFTGLRIGLAAARGFALAAGVPLVGVTSFEAAAHAVPEGARTGRTLLACVESRRDDLYLQPFGPDLRPLSDPADVLPADLPAFAAASLPPGPLLLAGDAADRTLAALLWADGVTVAAAPAGAEAAAVARIAGALVAADLASRPADPFYLRPPDVTLPGPRA